MGNVQASPAECMMLSVHIGIYVQSAENDVQTRINCNIVIFVMHILPRKKYHILFVNQTTNLH